MSHLLRSALVAYSAEQMFQLVNDIEAYPQYMDGCVGAEILSRKDDVIEARLDLSTTGISQSFVTRNHLEYPHAMHMSLLQGPFSLLEGGWRFQSLNADACKVILELDFEFKNRMLALAASKWFEGVANRQVDALCARAKVVYG